VRQVSFLEEARVEFLAEVAYYKEAERGLGARFRSSVRAAVALATELPEAGSPWKFATRRVFPKNFPYAVVYRIEQDVIIIVVVAHFRRKPGYWRSRVPKR
jgi:plasmid stabilization system protein ParE